jgi:osmoprotectant transport system permease protein
VIAVTIGFAIAFGLAILAHRRRWLTGPITGFTGALYTIPSIGAFILLLPITGRGNATGVIALVAYTLLILFRNITLGLNNVPRETVDAARGMGLTDRQLLWRVELPLAVPEIFAGLRIAATTTVGLLTLAYLAGTQGLGTKFSSPDQLSFKSNVVLAGGLCVLLAATFDVLLLTIQRIVTPWRQATR